MYDSDVLADAGRAFQACEAVYIQETALIQRTVYYCRPAVMSAYDTLQLMVGDCIDGQAVLLGRRHAVMSAH